LVDPTTRVLVVDDYEPWRHFVCSTLQQRPQIQVIGEASDGIDAVRKAQELQPDLILLDIGLPGINGIQAARQVRELLPNAKIIFLSAISSLGIAEETLRIGASGYVVKASARGELLPAVDAVLQGRTFMSAQFSPRLVRSGSDRMESVASLPNSAAAVEAEQAGAHEVAFYSDEISYLDDGAECVGAALKAGNAAVVIATQAHRDGLRTRLQADGLNMDAIIEQGRYIAMDAATALSTFMANGLPDSARFLQCFADVIESAAAGARAQNGEQARVTVFGEGVQLLCAQGKIEGAIQVEKLCNQLSHTHNVDILCAYSPTTVPGGVSDELRQRISTEHSVIRTSQLSC